MMTTIYIEKKITVIHLIGHGKNIYMYMNLPIPESNECEREDTTIF